MTGGGRDDDAVIAAAIGDQSCGVAGHGGPVQVGVHRAAKPDGVAGEQQEAAEAGDLVELLLAVVSANLDRLRRRLPGPAASPQEIARRADDIGVEHCRGKARALLRGLRQNAGNARGRRGTQGRRIQAMTGKIYRPTVLTLFVAGEPAIKSFAGREYEDLAPHARAAGGHAAPR